MAEAAGIPVRAVGRRLAGLGVALGAALMLAIGAWLAPDPAGHNTHAQLGLPACGWLQVTGRPCPTCGMTTAFAHAVHGSFLEAARVQPFGFLMAVAAAVAFWAGTHVALTGSRIGVFFEPLRRPRWLWTIAALAAASWAYKLATWPVV